MDPTDTTDHEQRYDDTSEDDIPYHQRMMCATEAAHRIDSTTRETDSDVDSDQSPRHELDDILESWHSMGERVRSRQLSEVIPWLRHVLCVCEAVEKERISARDRLEHAAVAAHGNSTAANDSSRLNTCTDGQLMSLILHDKALRLGHSEDSIPFHLVEEALKEHAAPEHDPAPEGAEDHSIIDDAPLTTKSHAIPSACDNKTKDKPSHGSRQKHPTSSAAKPAAKPLDSFGFHVTKSSENADNRNDNAFFTQFIEGDRLVPQQLRYWDNTRDSTHHNDGKCITDILRRNELDASTSYAPHNFNGEVVFILWANESFERTEMRPPYLGTSQRNRLELARPSYSSVPPDTCFEIPRVDGIDYDVDSGDEWDESVDGSSIKTEAHSDVSELDSSENDFIVPDDADESGSENAKDTNAMDLSERRELIRFRKQTAPLMPAFEGLFDDMPNAKNALGRTNRMKFLSDSVRESVISNATEYVRIARAIFEGGGRTVPDELLTRAEKEAAEAKRAREEAKLARAKLTAIKTTTKKLPKVAHALNTNSSLNFISRPVQDKTAEGTTPRTTATTLSGPTSQTMELSLQDVLDLCAPCADAPAFKRSRSPEPEWSERYYPQQPPADVESG